MRSLIAAAVMLLSTPSWSLDAACTTTPNLGMARCPEDSEDWYESYTDQIDAIDALAKTTTSSFTVKGAGGLGVTYGVSAGSVTIPNTVLTSTKATFGVPVNLGGSDTGISRISAGVVGIGDGSAGSFAGSAVTGGLTLDAGLPRLDLKASSVAKWTLFSGFTATDDFELYNQTGGANTGFRVKASNGFMGIGTGSVPNAKLHVSSGSGTTLWVDGNSAFPFRVGVSSLVTTSAGEFFMNGPTTPTGSDETVRIRGKKNAENILALDPNTAGNKVALYLCPDVNGIGTNCSQIHTDYDVGPGAGVGDLYLQAQTSGRIILAPNATESARFTSTGLGIGTASPASTLDVNGSAQFGSGAAKSTFSTSGHLTAIQAGVMAGASASSATVGGRVFYQDYTMVGVTTTTAANTVATGFSTFTVTANMLNRQGDCLEFTCSGTGTVNTNIKTPEVRWGGGFSGSGGTTVSGVSVTQSGASWRLKGSVCRRASSSTQIVDGEGDATNDGGATATKQVRAAVGAGRDLTASNSLTCGCTNGSASLGDCSFLSFRVNYAPAP